MNLNEMSVKELNELAKNVRKCLAAARLNEKQVKLTMKNVKAQTREVAKAERARLKEVRIAERKEKALVRLQKTEERLNKARAKVEALALDKKVGAVGIKAKREAKKPSVVTVVKV